MWTRVGSCSESDVGDDRIWHAGLAEDGRLALVFSWSEECILWDVFGSRVVLHIGEEYPELRDWIDPEGFVWVEDGPGRGRYRVFGVHHDYSKRRCPDSGLMLSIDKERASLFIRGRSTGEIFDLPYDCFSGDWAVPSFSENCRTIAVVEPYYFTFFSQGGRDDEPRTADPARRGD